MNEIVDTAPDASDRVKLYELRLFGRFELFHRPSGQVLFVPSPRMRALITYLAAAPRCMETRSTLISLLWPSKPEDLARQSLRELVSKSKRAGDPRLKRLVTGEEVLGLDASALTIDRAALFDTPADADIATLTQAVETYRGEFGAGIEIGGAEFDDWLRHERQRCRERAILLLDRLVRALGAAGRHADALLYANRLAKLDPLREETHRLVITAEAAVSGRASAMARFEEFRLLLKEELEVRPEPATLRLLETLRQARNAVGAEAAEVRETPSPLQAVEVADPRNISSAALTSRRRAALLAAFAVTLVAGVFLALREANIAGMGENRIAAEDRVPVALAPFNLDKIPGALRDQLKSYEIAEVKKLESNERMSLIAVPAVATTEQLLREAQAKHAVYVLDTEVVQTDDEPVAAEFLYDVTTGTRVFASHISMSGDAMNFARMAHDKMYPAILLDYTRALARQAPNSVMELFWQAAVDSAATGNRIDDPPEFRNFEAVLARQPGNIDATVGLAWSLVERAARDQSNGLNRTDDISRASRLIRQAQIAKAPKSSSLQSRIAFVSGLINKVEGLYPEARADFVVSAALDPTSTNAAAQVAHVDLFLGRIEEAYAEMEAIPQLDYAETAFIAGETALMANHPKRALFYYDRAVSITSGIPRNYAWRAVALWRLHREVEARQSALKSQEMTPAYRVYWMASRAPLGDRRYRDARDLCARDFQAVLISSPPESPMEPRAETGVTDPKRGD